MNKTFDELNKVNCNDLIEVVKTGRREAKYLSWANAIKIVNQKCESFDYEVLMFDGKPYQFDGKTGYMVWTKVTIDGKSNVMWLPVMDANNDAMLDREYTIKIKHYENGRWDGTYDEKIVSPATMFDINKTIMRCLTKNLAMFGLGLYIYAGEDLPETEEPKEEPKPKTQAQINTELIIDLTKRTNGYYTYQAIEDFIQKKYRKGIQDLNATEIRSLVTALDSKYQVEIKVHGK